MYSQEELDRISKMKEKNDKLEEYFKERREEWSKNLDPIFKVLQVDLKSPSNLRIVIETQTNILTYKQLVNEQVAYFLNRISKEMTNVKKLRQEKFVYYATGYSLKTNTGEKNILIDAHIAEWDRGIEIIQTHIDFLRDTGKTIESIAFSIKNMIELINYLGK